MIQKNERRRYASDLSDSQWAIIEPLFPRAGYRKTFEQDVSRVLGLGADISARIKPEWEILPKRWIVERSLAWFNNSRRLSKDYEISVQSSQAVCLIAASRTLLKRFYSIDTAFYSGPVRLPCPAQHSGVIA